MEIEATSLQGAKATLTVIASEAKQSTLSLRRKMDCFVASLLAMTVFDPTPHAMSVSTFPRCLGHCPAVIAREAGRPSIPEAAVKESRSRGVPDTPLEPVIGLAEGETRWRGMGGLEEQRHCEERKRR